MKFAVAYITKSYIFQIGKVASNRMMHNQNMFSPCVAFRVIGHPVKHINSKYFFLQ